MRSRKTRYATLTLCVLTAWTAQALAQGGAEPTDAEPTSFTSMFFWSDSRLGLVLIYLLLTMSVATVGLIIHYVLQNRRTNILSPSAKQDIGSSLNSGLYGKAIEIAQRDPSVFGRIIGTALGESSHGYGAMERAIEESGDVAITSRVRALDILNVFGAVGPMIGLFGTVYGMIITFQAIEQTGGRPDVGQLAGGISTALVTTFWGLLVGIPATAAAALIRNRIEGLVTEAMAEADAMIGRFRPAPQSDTTQTNTEPRD